MYRPEYVLRGGPLDGATGCRGIFVTFPDGAVSGEFHGPRPDFRLWYVGCESFCDRPAVLAFAGWLPIETQEARGMAADADGAAGSPPHK